jgi:hypothetical protein
MDTKKKKQLGPRIKQDSYETLAGFAAAKGCSLNYYLEAVLEDHVARQRHPDAGGGIVHDLIDQINERLPHMFSRSETPARGTLALPSSGSSGRTKR